MISGISDSLLAQFSALLTAGRLTEIIRSTTARETGKGTAGDVA